MDIRYSGLDRLDSSKGYIHGNVVPCCRNCNVFRGRIPVEKFFEMIERIHSHNTSSEDIRRRAATLFESPS